MGGREGGLKWWIVVGEGGGRRMNTPMLIGDGTSVLMYVFLVCCAPRLPPPLFTGPLARPDLCHHPPYKHFPLHHSQSGKRGRAAARERGREREGRGGGESRLPSPLISPRMQIPSAHFPNIALLQSNCLGSAYWTERLPFFQAESCPRRESRACSAPTRGETGAARGAQSGEGSRAHVNAGASTDKLKL